MHYVEGKRTHQRRYYTTTRKKRLKKRTLHISGRPNIPMQELLDAAGRAYDEKGEISKRLDIIPEGEKPG